MTEKIFRSTCTMDCPDSCALEIAIADGKIKSITGSDSHPNTDGFICNKISRFTRRVYHEKRIRYPLRRTGSKGSGEFQQISWSAAIDEIVERFHQIIQEYGAEAILPYHYGGSNGLLGDDGIDRYFFARLGASRIEKTLCAAPTTAVATAMYGKMPGVAYQDYALARCVIIWGANPKVSHIHLIPYLRRAKNSGCFIAVIDPRRNFSRDEIDLHLAVTPGTDLILALGMINYWNEKELIDREFIRANSIKSEYLLEQARHWPLQRAASETGLSVNDIQILAEQYARSDPAVIRCGWGVERNRNGGQAVAAILAIPALLNKFGVRGGGYTMSNSGALKIDQKKLFGSVDWNSRQLNMTQLGQILNQDLEPPVKSIFVYNCNPVATVPDQNQVISGLKREDLFTIVAEQVKTDTVLHADLVLPVVTFMEQYELKRGYGSYVLGGVQKVIEPVGESRTNEEIFCALGKAMGWMTAPFTWTGDEYFKKMLDAIQTSSNLPDINYFKNGENIELKFDGAAPVQFGTVFPQTDEGKVNLTPSVLGTHPYTYFPHDPTYPYTLISPATSKLISSSLGEYNYPELKLEMNEMDAAKQDIHNGDRVRIYNDLGEVICRVQTTLHLREGVVLLPKGAWTYSSQNGQTSTALCADHVNDVAGGACYNDARVSVQRLSS